MRQRRGQRGIGRVAFAVALLMALQALLSPLALAASAGASPLDAFGNPLCITHVEQPEPASAPGKAHSSASDCCTLACGMVLSFVPTDRSDFIVFDPLAQPSRRMSDGYGDAPPSVHEALPGHPRGPPALA